MNISKKSPIPSKGRGGASLHLHLQLFEMTGALGWHEFILDPNPPCLGQLPWLSPISRSNLPPFFPLTALGPPWVHNIRLT